MQRAIRETSHLQLHESLWVLVLLLPLACSGTSILASAVTWQRRTQANMQWFHLLLLYFRLHMQTRLQATYVMFTGCSRTFAPCTCTNGPSYQSTCQNCLNWQLQSYYHYTAVTCHTCHTCADGIKLSNMCKGESLEGIEPHCCHPADCNLKFLTVTWNASDWCQIGLTPSNGVRAPLPHHLRQ